MPQRPTGEQVAAERLDVLSSCSRRGRLQILHKLLEVKDGVGRALFEGIEVFSVVDERQSHGVVHQVGVRSLMAALSRRARWISGSK